jgi:rare lipoprotein A
VKVRICTTPSKGSASRLLAVATLVAALLIGGGISPEVPQAAAATRAQHKAAKAARHQRQHAKLAARRARAKARKAARRKKAAPTGWRTARASWYGPGFYGHGMAGGGTLQQDSMVIAHKSLPFGTLVEVSINGTSVVAPIRDRGPYVRGREFDLGPGVRRALGVWGVFTIRYRIVG